MDKKDFIEWLKTLTPWLLALISFVVFAMNSNYVSGEKLNQTVTAYVRNDVYTVKMEDVERRLGRIEEQNEKILDRLDGGR